MTPVFLNPDSVATKVGPATPPLLLATEPCTILAAPAQASPNEQHFAAERTPGRPQLLGPNAAAERSISPPLSPRGSGTCTPSRLRSKATWEIKPGNATTSRNYGPDVSIALIGFRGTGLSTLAVMASAALGFRLVDADQHFYHATGLSRGAYRSAHGVAQYRLEELRQMRSILSDNQSKAIIVCGPGAIEGTGQSLLSEYAKVHPVVYVMRDIEGIQKHLFAGDNDTISHLLHLSCPIHRSLSAFEFYNLDEPSLPPNSETEIGQRSPRTLALKQLEGDFLQLVYSITKRTGKETKCDTRYGLGSLPLETRSYTYALSLTMSNLTALALQLRDIDTSADAVELIIPVEDIIKPGARLDNVVANNITRQYYTLRRAIWLPVIFHIESHHLVARNTGHDHATSLEEVYFDVLHHALRLAPEYLTVDLRADEQRIRGLVAAKGSTRIIGHYFEESPGKSGWSSPERKALAARGQDLGCDMIRLSQTAVALEDNFTAQTFMHELKTSGTSRVPLIAYNTGPLGRMSNFLNRILTPVTDPLIRTHVPECPTSSLLTITEAQGALYSSFALDPMKFGIYGGNVSQSLSPAMHNAAFRHCGMPHTYQAYTYPTLQELGAIIHDSDFGGVSITAPFKREVIHLVDKLSTEAQAIGAVNTLLPLRTADANSLAGSNRKGPVMALYGGNTDWIGIHACIRRNLSPINAVRRRTSGLIIGAGGMARAAAYAMIRSGVRNIFVYNRSPRNAEELARQFSGHQLAEPHCEHSASGLRDSTTSIITGGKTSSDSDEPLVKVIYSKEDPWPSDADHPTIVVSSVPHSANGQPMADNTLHMNWLASPTGGVIIELAYTPLETPLLEQARGLADRGWIAVDGLQVLPEQGTVQFEIFTGRKAPRATMWRAVCQAYAQRLEGPDLRTTPPAT